MEGAALRCSHGSWLWKHRHYVIRGDPTDPGDWSRRGSGPMSTSGGEAVTYQRLRAHLGFLKLPAAAEALPGILDVARGEDLSTVAVLEALLAVEVETTQARGWRHGCGSLVCQPIPAWTRPTSPPSPASSRNSCASWPRCASSTTRLCHLRHPDHRHHPQSQPPLLLAALPRRRLARPPPPQRRC